MEVNSPTPGEAPYLTRFEVSDVKAKPVQQPEGVKEGHIALQLNIYKQSNCGEILQGTTFPGKNVLPANNGFVDAVTNAYNHHHHLIIRPDDVWLSIMTQFSFYLNARAEEFRSKFVNFEGKKELVVYGGGNIFSASYSGLVTAMEEAIHQNLVDPEVRDWIMPNFSTTTKDDRITSGVVFMAAMKKYFDYKFCLLCGIPSVTLDGTLADWQEIRRRLDKLDSYKLKDWSRMLKPVLDEFVNAKSGNADTEFWTRICHYEGGGSGPRYLSGWITNFCLFDKDGKLQGKFDDDAEWARVDTNAIPPGIVEIDVTVDDNGEEYKTIMLAGSMGMEIGEGGNSLQPRSGWVIALKGQGKSEDK